MNAALDFVLSCAALGAIFGGLVALPGPVGRLETLRSPRWALVLPGMLLVGTFGVLALPAMASGLVMLASLATPVLAGIAVVAVVRGGRRRVVLISLAVVLAAGLTGSGQVAAAIVTALGCLTLGTGLARLTPSPWLGIGVLAMCAVDVLLLSTGIGQPAGSLLHHAMSGSDLPALNRAGVGPISADYPDMVLAAVVGGVLAGHEVQRRAALLVAALAGAYASLLTIADVLPATVPLALVLVLLEGAPRLRRMRDAAPSRSRHPSALRPLPADC